VKKVGFIQINNSFSNQNYFPYAAGILQAYAEKNLNAVAKDEIVFAPYAMYKRVAIKSIVKMFSKYEVVFFSCYVWNINFCIEIARQLKEIDKNKIIVFGGPHITSHNYNVNDMSIIGEGETEVLNILNDDFSSEAKPSYIKAGFIEDINTIPSPYLEGTFDMLMKLNPNENWIGMWETSRGCPYGCTYCDWGSAKDNKIRTYNLDRLYEEIDWFSHNKIEFVFCCDANFGMLERDIKIVERLTKNKRKYGYPKAFSTQGAKNFNDVTYETYKILAKEGLNKGLALSLQSIHKPTLKAVGRANMAINNFKEVQEKLTRNDIKTFTDLIIALPEETYATFVNGACKIIENGQYNRIQFNNLSILPNAKMGQVDHQKKYGFEIMPVKMVNLHGKLAPETIAEYQNIVVGTNTMHKDDWLKCRVFGWMCSLLYFNKLLQIPFLILNKLYNVKIRDLIELFMYETNGYKLLEKNRDTLFLKAEAMQKGFEPEFTYSRKYLGIYWPVDEFLMIQMCTQQKIALFYEESLRLVKSYLEKNRIEYNKEIVHDAFYLNMSLLKRPIPTGTTLGVFPSITFIVYDVWKIYKSLLIGDDPKIKKLNGMYKIKPEEWKTIEEWCEKVVWYGNKKGDYLYEVK